MQLNDDKVKKLLDELLGICRENLRTVNEDLIKKAFKLSFEAHKNHFRASGESYFVHPFEVAMIVAREIPLDDVSVISALLHDVVEDTDISIEFIEQEFGKEIADIVDGVTKIGGVFRGQNITQAENYRKLLLSMINDVRVILVKFADRLHNMRTLEYVSQHKQRRIATETLEIYAPFAFLTAELRAAPKPKFFECVMTSIRLSDILYCCNSVLVLSVEPSSTNSISICCKV